MRPAVRLLSCATLLALAPTLAGTAWAAEPATAAPRSAAPKPATPHQQLRNQAKGLALATETAEQINQAQLDVAARVLTGDADCEFNQKIIVNPVQGQPGHFTVGFKKAVYRMVPHETTTGAVRLEDRKAGIVWLQIPTKSMLMNSKIGQRMVDACTHSEQRAAVAAAEAAARSVQAAPVAAAAAAPAAASAVADSTVAAAPPADAASAAKAE